MPMQPTPYETVLATKKALEEAQNAHYEAMEALGLAVRESGAQVVSQSTTSHMSRMTILGDYPQFGDVMQRGGVYLTVASM